MAVYVELMLCERSGNSTQTAKQRKSRYENKIMVQGKMVNIPFK